MSELKVISYPSHNFDERNSAIDGIIIHATECRNAEEALAILTSPESQVSSHYLIDKKGIIYSIVDDDKRAWHAGQSAWESKTHLNHSTIGIELDHPEPSRPAEYPQEQISCLLQLLQELTQKYDIPSHNILAHSDIAPDRKQDPGNDFPWECLAKHGFGCWVPFSSFDENLKMNEDEAKVMLKEIGYRQGNFSSQIRAFQRHFLRHHVDGKLDAETVHRLTQIKQEIVARRTNSS